MRERHLLILLAGLFLTLFLLCSGMVLPFELALHLAVGWVFAPSNGTVPITWAATVLVLVIAVSIHNLVLHWKTSSEDSVASSVSAGPNQFGLTHRAAMALLATILVLSGVFLEYVRKEVAGLTL